RGLQGPPRRLPGSAPLGHVPVRPEARDGGVETHRRTGEEGRRRSRTCEEEGGRRSRTCEEEGRRRPEEEGRRQGVSRASVRKKPPGPSARAPRQGRGRLFFYLLETRLYVPSPADRRVVSAGGVRDEDARWRRRRTRNPRSRSARAAFRS